MITKLVFLGGGNMAQAIFATLSTNPNFKIVVIQRNTIKAQQLQQLYPQIQVLAQLDAKLDAANILILAIKPQDAKESCLAIQKFTKNCLIVSVMAGINCTSINSWLNNSKIVRCMPNTPCKIGMGISALYYSATVNSKQQTIVQQMFTPLGLIHILTNEEQIDKIIPFTSSSVAFIYYFMEAFVDYAVNNLGLTNLEARNLISHTMQGTIALSLADSNSSLAQLREQVTSKRGATEQGILCLAANNFHQNIAQAMNKCYQRALDMAEEFNN